MVRKYLIHLASVSWRGDLQNRPYASNQIVQYFAHDAFSEFINTYTAYIIIHRLQRFSMPL
jgi:hypothetical protein